MITSGAGARWRGRSARRLIDPMSDADLTNKLAGIDIGVRALKRSRFDVAAFCDRGLTAATFRFADEELKPEIVLAMEARLAEMRAALDGYDVALRDLRHAVICANDAETFEQFNELGGQIEYLSQELRSFADLLAIGVGEARRRLDQLNEDRK